MTNHRRQITRDLNSYLTKIAHPYQCRQAILSYGIWNISLNMIEIIHQHRSAGKYFLTKGMMKHSKLYLYPEEAIYMMQSSLLQVSITNFDKKPNIPISLDEAYSLWFNQSLFPLQYLHVYQYLTRIGFILIRSQIQIDMIEKKDDLLSTQTKNNKRKRNEYENESVNIALQNDNCICPIHLSSDCQRQWFPNYTDDSPISMKDYPRLIFPDKLFPFHIDWVPSDFDSKVSIVQLSIYQNNISTPRPSYSLLRSIDLQSHRTIYQRLSSIAPHLKLSSLSSSIVYNMYTPKKHFRKTQPGPPDYQIQIKNGNDEFNFDEIYNTQQSKTLTAVDHNGDVCFYLFKPFDPVQALQ